MRNNIVFFQNYKKIILNDQDILKILCLRTKKKMMIKKDKY